jgi:hypothetical protein
MNKKTEEERVQEKNNRRELDILRKQLELLVAKYTKLIWTDPIYNDYKYPSKTTLQKAELIIRLSEDAEYVKLDNRITELSSELNCLDFDDFDINE